jgi:hypothetical protein
MSQTLGNTHWKPLEILQLGVPLGKRSPEEVYRRRVLNKVSPGERERLEKLLLKDIFDNAPRDETGEYLVRPPTFEDKLEYLRNSLQTALLIELSTIPLYLYPTFSMKDPNSAVSRTVLGTLHNSKTETRF